MEARALVPTAQLSREAWLAERRRGIGGSDVSAILGLNEHSSPYSVWADKLGMLPEREDTEAMRQGRDLEDYVARRFCEATGKRVRRRNAILFSERYPFMMANIDRDIVGENAGLECKTTSIMNLKRFRGGDYPVNYYCQCMHYMAVTGAKKWYLAVLILNQGFHTFEIERDEGEISELIQAESDFWKLVETRTPPPIDGTEATRKALEAANRPDDDNPPALLYGKEELITALEKFKQEKKWAEKAIGEIDNSLRAALGSSTTGLMHGYEIRLQTISKQPYMVTPKPYTTLRIEEVDDE